MTEGLFFLNQKMKLLLANNKNYTWFKSQLDKALRHHQPLNTGVFLKSIHGGKYFYGVVGCRDNEYH